MSVHLERAQLLLAQSRPADAEREVMLALVVQPDNWRAFTLLALSRIAQNKRDPALAAARDAVGAAPLAAYTHYVLAHVLDRLDQHDDAFRAINEALRLDPLEADFFAELSSIELSRRNWSAALEAAERGLALNPEHVDAANFRAMALVNLGRKAEAVKTVHDTLHRAPENAFSHANQGWNYLHQNNPHRAQEHFREALRLDPTLEYAREGMLEALKARNPVYRAMLAYFLWIGRQSSRFQWGVVIGIYFGTRFIRGLSTSLPQLNLLWWPLLGLLYAFGYLTWTAQPMFNLLLRFDRFGRHVLSPDQRTGSTWFGIVFGGLLLALASFPVIGGDLPLIAALLLGMLSIAVAATFNREGRERRILGGYTIALAAIAASAHVLFLANNPTANLLMGAFVLGFVGFQILANLQPSR